MKHSMKTMMLTAAVSGLLGGSAVRLQAAQTSTPEAASSVSASHATSGKISFTKVAFDEKDKHSCKGKNDCKGQGGCKSSDNGATGRTIARARADALPTDLKLRSSQHREDHAGWSSSMGQPFLSG